MDPLSATLKMAASGLAAQSLRLRIVSENLANIESAGKTPGSDPYRRKTVTFGEEIDRLTGAMEVKIERVGTDPSPFRTEYDPGHPAADAGGYVKLPNVNMIVELADMRQANRSYDANLQVIKQAREMISMTIDLLRAQA
ncbi:MAG: flagellar basal body rod protein FlgC [Rhizobiales bacterium]|nr:flagellar basal body rod protein FlgC [Hyphomicrobiales bacterium]MBI3672803.1 flagellar basal body rod protein FlgC [Hyphomicrobiales bacterium]